MAPGSAAADEVVEPYVRGSSSSGDAEEYTEVEEAPSHLPFAPSYEPSDTLSALTTVDPSYIISLIRKILPRDKDKVDSMKEKVAMEAVVDIGSLGDLAKDYMDNVKRVSVDPSSCGEEGSGICEHKQTDLLGTEAPWEECGCILWDLSVNKTHAEFMVDNLLLEVLLANLQVSKSLRVTSFDFLTAITNNQEVSSILLLPLIKLGLPYLMASLLAGELSKFGVESKPERSSILDLILGLVEALSTSDNYSQVIISNGELLLLVCGVVKLPDKIEAANSCVSAVIILANLLEDEKRLLLELSQDFSFLQGLLDILPFVSDDPPARSAFWCVMARLLAQVQENDIGISTLQQFASLFADKSHHIEEDIESHPGEDLDDNRSIIPALRRIVCILEKWSMEKSAVSKKSVDDSIDDDSDSKVQRLLHCCLRYRRLK